MMSEAQKAAAKAKEDRGFLFVDPTYLRDLEEFIKLGRFKVSNDRYKYSTSSIVLPKRFEIESIFEENASSNVKISKDRIKSAVTSIKKFREDTGGGIIPVHQHTNGGRLEAEEFSDMYQKLLKKRRDDTLRNSEQTRLAKEIESIKDLKTKKFIETETLRLGGTLSREEMEKLDKKIVQFKDGLSYANEKLNYRSAGKMLRNLRAIPQPALKLDLGKRTRLYSFKTEANLSKAINDIINDGVSISQHPELRDFMTAIYRHPGKPLSFVPRLKPRTQASNMVANNSKPGQTEQPEQPEQPEGSADAPSNANTSQIPTQVEGPPAPQPNYRLRTVRRVKSGKQLQQMIAGTKRPKQKKVTHGQDSSEENSIINYAEGLMKAAPGHTKVRAPVVQPPRMLMQKSLKRTSSARPTVTNSSPKPPIKVASPVQRSTN